MENNAMAIADEKNQKICIPAKILGPVRSGDRRGEFEHTTHGQGGTTHHQSRNRINQRIA
jgi:hypothetical protein